MIKVLNRAMFLLLSLTVAGNTVAQENTIGIHQLQAEEMRGDLVSVSKKQSSESIIPLQTDALEDKELGRIIFGFLPYWEYSSGAHNNMQYDALSHIAVSFFEIRADGGISNPSNWPWVDVINGAHTEGTKVIMTVSNFGITDDELGVILRSTTQKDVFFSNIKSIISTYSLDGVNIDFEAFNTADRGVVINSFMADLTEFIHSELPGKEVSFDAPAINWSGWDFGGLVDAVDHLFVMSYDYNKGDVADPVAPLYPGSWAYCVDRTITRDYATAVMNSPEKIILGVPYYGRKFKTNDSNLYSTIVSKISSTRYATDFTAYESYGRQWDGNSHTPWYKYQSGGDWYQVYSDDQASLSEKYDYAIANKLGGIGIWALNYDSTRPELWDLIRDKFEGLPSLSTDDFADVKISVYPNPVQNILNVDVSGVEGKVIIYSILGEVIYEGTSGKISTESWDKGLYFVSVDVGNRRQVFKLMK